MVKLVTVNAALVNMLLSIFKMSWVRSPMICSTLEVLYDTISTVKFKKDSFGKYERNFVNNFP